jgi:hypothetical protein
MQMSKNLSRKSESQRIMGRQVFAAISSVEGLELSENSKSRLDKLDAEGLSAREKRDAVIQVYLSQSRRDDV